MEKMRTKTPTILERLDGERNDALLLQALRASVQDCEGMRWEVLVAPGRQWAKVTPRRRAVAVYSELAADRRGETLAPIFNRDRTTIIHDTEMHAIMMHTDRYYRANYRALLKAVVDKLKYLTLINNNNSMFTSTISGNLGRAAEVKNINGKEYYKFSLAAAGRRKDDAPTWVNVLYYKGGNSRLGDFLVSGASVVVQGRQEVSAYTRKDGQPAADVTIWADMVEVTRYADSKPADNDLPADNEDDLRF